MAKKEATIEELRAEWKRIEDYWDRLNADGEMIDYPWTRSRFMLGVFKTMVNQRGWRVPTMLGGPL